MQEILKLLTQAIPLVEEKAFLRQDEKDKYLSVILERKSFLVVADAGSGKTTMAIDTKIKTITKV